MLATYAMFLRALFTKDFQHYKTVWEARRTLLALTTKVSKLSEETWSILTWCIIDDARQFFSAVVDQSDFDENGRADNLPTSLLVYHTTQLRMLQPFMPHDFPDQWRATTRQRLDSYKQPAERTGENKSGGGSHREKDTRGPIRIKTEPTRPGANQKEMSWQTDTHPKLKELMETVRSKYEHLPLRPMLDKGGKVFDDLPNHKTSSGKLACNRHILGRCSAPGKKCHFAHVPGSELSAAFVDSMCAVLRPGIMKLTLPPLPGMGGVGR